MKPLTEARRVVSDQSLAQVGACYQGVGVEKLLLGGRAGPVSSFPSHHTPECPFPPTGDLPDPGIEPFLSRFFPYEYKLTLNLLTIL